MTLAPFFAAPGHVQVHLVAALVVMALTPLQFLGFRKGSMPHRISGYGWLAAMLVVAISSFSITNLIGPSAGGYGVIHLLSLAAIFSSVMIVIHARAGRVIAHRAYVKGLTIGFFIAGIFTLVPPRLMTRIFELV